MPWRPGPNSSLLYYLWYEALCRSKNPARTKASQDIPKLNFCVNVLSPALSPHHCIFMYVPYLPISSPRVPDSRPVSPFGQQLEGLWAVEPGTLQMGSALSTFMLNLQTSRDTNNRKRMVMDSPIRRTLPHKTQRHPKA